MATSNLLHLNLQARFDGCQPLETSKLQCRGLSSTNLACLRHSSLVLLQRDASPLRAVASASVEGDATKQMRKQIERPGPGEPWTKEMRKQVKWEKMMREIEESDSAVSVLQTHREAKTLSKKAILGTLMRLRQLKKWSSIVEALDWLKEQGWWNFSVQDYNLLVTAYGKLGQPEKAESSISMMRDSGLEPNVAILTSLLEAYARIGNFIQAETILMQMLETGPAPTEVTYQMYINMLCKAKRYEDAERIFKSMEDRDGAKPDARLFNLMIHTYGKAGKITESQNLFRRMKGLGFPLSAVTFNSLMAFQNTVPDAEACLRQMQLANIKPDVVTYTGLIKVYAKARRAEEAQEIFREMVAAGVRPSRTAYNTLLDAYAKSKEVQGAESVFKKMSQDKCRPDVHSYTTLLAAYANTGDMKKAKQLLVRMKKDGIEPNVVTYGTLMLGYTSVNDTDALLQTFEDLKTAGLKPNETIFTLLVRTFGQMEDFEAAFSWFKDMIASGCSPDQRSRSALMDACQSSEQKQLVLEYLGSIA